MISTHRPNLPPNKFTPRIENINQKIKQTRKTFPKQKFIHYITTALLHKISLNKPFHTQNAIWGRYFGRLLRDKWKCLQLHCSLVLEIKDRLKLLCYLIYILTLLSPSNSDIYKVTFNRRMCHCEKVRDVRTKINNGEDSEIFFLQSDCDFWYLIYRCFSK